MSSLLHMVGAFRSRDVALAFVAVAALFVTPTPARADHAPNKCFPDDFSSRPAPGPEGIYPGVYDVLFEDDIPGFCDFLFGLRARVGGTLIASTMFSHSVQWGGLGDAQVALLRQEPLVVAVDPASLGSGGGPGTTIPEPSTVLLVGAGVGALGATARLRRRRPPPATVRHTGAVD